MNAYNVLGTVLLVTGIVLNTVINRRRFYRRGPGGLQHFETYSGAVATTWLERIGKLIAIILIIVGIGGLLSRHDENGHKEKSGKVIQKDGM